ncbi:MAG: carbonic anhydrase [Bryobacterales bacterium]|nr:carbonic anhydrase [Bryobacterales bacterium]
MKRSVLYPSLSRYFAAVWFAGCLLMGAWAAPQAPAAAPAKEAKVAAHKPVTADEALAKLKAGNHRYATHHLKHPDQSARRMHEVEEAQHPFAIVLGCSDSRVPPEILFDQGLGDLFVIRVAGNVPDDEVVGSIEYAVEHLHTPLVVVLGHEQCGAVTAATHEPEANHTRSFTDWLRPLVDAVRGQPGDLIHNAMCLSVTRIVHELRESEPVLKEAVEKRHVRIVGAHYELKTGKVIWDRELP